jgi:hypothetical protein
MSSPAMEITITAGHAHQQAHRRQPFYANVVVKTGGGVMKGGKTQVNVHRFCTEQKRDAFIKEYPR